MQRVGVNWVISPFFVFAVVWCGSFAYIYHVIIKEMDMLTVEQRSGQDDMGFTWFEVFKNGKTTGSSFNALDEDHAIRMYNQFRK